MGHPIRPWRTPPAGLLSSAEAARLLGCSPRHVTRLCQDGHLEAIKIRTAWCIRPEEVARFLRRPTGRPRSLVPSARTRRRWARVAALQRQDACAS